MSHYQPQNGPSKSQPFRPKAARTRPQQAYRLDFTPRLCTRGMLRLQAELKRERYEADYKHALQEVGSARTGVEKSSGGRRRFGLRWIEKSPRGPGVVVIQPVANTLLPVRRAHSPQWFNVALSVLVSYQLASLIYNIQFFTDLQSVRTCGCRIRC